MNTLDDNIDTITQSDTEENGNTNHSSSGNRLRNWTFTWNNYPTDWASILTTAFGQAKYTMQEETGTNDTPHIQGVVAYKNARSLASMKKIHPKIHWEKCRNLKASIQYCKKTDTRTGIVIDTNAKPPVLETLRPWQKDVEDLILTEPDDRTINWYYDETGGQGKTKLAKHLCMKYEDVIFVTGKASDIKYAIKQHIDAGKTMKTIIFGFTRTIENFVSYQAIEEVKDGIFFNTKYETGMVIYDEPHVLIFANFLPKEENLSADRWRIITLE